MVELTYLAIIGIGLAAMFFGYGFGLFEGRSQGYKKRTKEEASEKKDEPAPPSPPQTVTETVTVTVDDPGLLRIKNEQGSFALDLDGTRVNPTSLSAEQRKRLIELLNIMRPWLEGRPAPAPAPVVTPPPSPPPAPIQTPPTPAPVQPASAPPPPPPAASRPATIAKDDRPAAPANSIVAQIDSILQANLAGTPLESRGIFLSQSPEGGVNVYVGLTRYNGIDDVLDPEIKAAIRAAIAEWERKYTPGLK
jgi:hypothetical protein